MQFASLPILVFQMVTSKKYERDKDLDSGASAIQNLDPVGLPEKSKGKGVHVYRTNHRKSQFQLPIQSQNPVSQLPNDTDLLSYGLNFPIQSNLLTFQQPYLVNSDTIPPVPYAESITTLRPSGNEYQIGSMMSQSITGQHFTDISSSINRNSFSEDVGGNQNIPLSSSSDDFSIGSIYNQSNFSLQGEQNRLDKSLQQSTILSAGSLQTAPLEATNTLVPAGISPKAPDSTLNTKFGSVPVNDQNSLPSLEAKQKLKKQKLVKIALRKRCYKRKRKLVSGKTRTNINNALFDGNSKHQGRKSRIGRPLNPRTRIKLTLVPNLMSLHSLLVSTHKTQDITILTKGNFTKDMVAEELNMDPTVEWKFRPNQHGEVFPGQAHTLILVDKGYKLKNEESRVHVSSYLYPGAIGLEYTKMHADDETRFSGCDENGNAKLMPPHQTVIPIYDDFALAVSEIFHIKAFSLVRVTRAAAFERTGAIVLKLETAHPGDLQLNDEDEIVDNGRNNEDGRNYLGKQGDPITTAFIKKRIARPRYKADMRIYFIPRDTNTVLYSSEAMLERDLLNGILSPTAEKRLVICAFDYHPLLQKLSTVEKPQDLIE